MEGISQVEQLIAAYKTFLEESGERSKVELKDFGAWLVRRARPEIPDGHDNLGEEDMLLGMFLVSLFNLVKSRMNKLVAKTPFSNVMDYHFLVLLHSHGRQTKSELIVMNRMEMSSGIEVIRRLVKNNWIEEEPNDSDRRSTYVVITNTGKQMINVYKQPFDEFYQSLSPDLGLGEKKDVLSSIEKLITNIAAT